MTEKALPLEQHPLLSQPFHDLDESLKGLSPIKTTENDREEDENHAVESPTSFKTAHSHSPLKNQKPESDDILNVSKSLDSIALNPHHAPNGPSSNTDGLPDESMEELNFSLDDNSQQQHQDVSFDGITSEKRNLSSGVPSKDNKTAKQPAENVVVDNAEEFSLVKSPRKKKSKCVPNDNDVIDENTPLASSNSFLLFKIPRLSDIANEDSLMDTVRSIFKNILRSSNQVGIIAPSQFNLPTIYDNRQLPKKLDTKAIRRFIHYGRMSNDNFIGKILIEHSCHFPSNFFTSTPEMLKLMDSRNGSSIQVDRFGNDRIIKIGFLVGALSKESRDDLAYHIETIVETHLGYLTPIMLSREKICKDIGQDNDQLSEFVWATSVRCKDCEAEKVTDALAKAFGRPSFDSDYFRPLMRFVPVDIVMSNSKTRNKFIAEHRQLDSQVTLLRLKNMKPLDSLVTLPSSSEQENNKVTLRYLLSGITDKSSSQRIFHAVCYHGIDEDTVILASVRSFSNTIRHCRSHFTSVAQETYPWIQDSDIFETPRNHPKVIFGLGEIGDPTSCEDHLDSLFSFLKEDFPSLSDNEESSKSSTKGPEGNPWRKNHPSFNSTKEEIDVASYSGLSTPAPSRMQSRPARSNRNKKARVKQSTEEKEVSSQLSDSDMSEGTRRSRLREAKLSNKANGTNATPVQVSIPPAVPHKKKQRNLMRAPRTSLPTLHAWNSIQISERTTPSTLTDLVDPDVLRLQQEEIATLRENIYVLNEQVNSLQVSMHEQSQRAEQLNSTVGSIQASFQEQQVSQTNLSLSISELKDDNLSLKSDISAVMLMLSKMDSTLSSISVQASPPPTLRSGEASQDRPATC